MNSFYLFVLVVALGLSGCGRKDPASEKPIQREQVGITFKGGKGLRISNETKKIIGLEIVEATDQKLAAQFFTTVQVYGYSGAHAEATGFVTEQDAKQVKENQIVTLNLPGSAATGFEGKVVRLVQFAQSAQTEVLIQIPDAEKQLKIGTTLEATFTAQEAQTVTAIPRSAVLKTTEGTFAYVVNGDYFFRTPIKTGAENKDFIEVKDGLYAGDQIVKQPVRTLWIAELQAIKGGADND